MLSVGVFLPPYQQCTKLHLGQILAGKVQVLRKKDVPRLSCPKWPELGISTIWPQVQNDKELMTYFPKDYLLSKKQPPREFFWGIMQSVRPNYCETLIKEAQHRR